MGHLVKTKDCDINHTLLSRHIWSSRHQIRTHSHEVGEACELESGA